MNSIDDFKKLLREKVITFMYTKINGEERIARGTLQINKEIVGENFIEPKGCNHMKKNKDLVNYWDIDKDGWRSFDFNNLIKYEE